MLVLTRSRLPATLPMVAAQLALGAVIHAGLFLLAVGGEGRREYLRHADALLRKRDAHMSRIGTANAS